MKLAGSIVVTHILPWAISASEHMSARKENLMILYVWCGSLMQKHWLYRDMFTICICMPLTHCMSGPGKDFLESGQNFHLLNILVLNHDVETVTVIRSRQLSKVRICYNHSEIIKSSYPWVLFSLVLDILTLT